MVDWKDTYVSGNYFDGISIAITTFNSNYWDFSLSMGRALLIQYEARPTLKKNWCYQRLFGWVVGF